MRCFIASQWMVLLLYHNHARANARTNLNTLFKYIGHGWFHVVPYRVLALVKQTRRVSNIPWNVTRDDRANGEDENKNLVADKPARRNRNWFWHVPAGHNFSTNGARSDNPENILKFRKSLFERENVAFLSVKNSGPAWGSPGWENYERRLTSALWNTYNCFVIFFSLSAGA